VAALVELIAPKATHGLTEEVFATGAGTGAGDAATAPVVTDIRETPTAKAVNIRIGPAILNSRVTRKPVWLREVRQHCKRCTTISVASSRRLIFGGKK
jgi:hypothetical protein